MRRRDDHDVEAEPEEIDVVRERPRARVLGERLGPVGRADSHQLNVVERGDPLEMHRDDHARAEDPVAKRHAPSSRRAATQSRVASSQLPSRW